MTRAEFAKGSAAFLAVIVVGFLSTAQLDRNFVAAEAAKSLTPEVSKNATPNDRPDASAPGKSSTPCVRKDGSWKNWPWSNVPTLSPKCVDDH